MSLSSLYTPIVRERLPRKARTLDVCGQCSCCLDFFSVNLYFARGIWHISETPHLAWSLRVTTHPDGTTTQERVLRHIPKVTPSFCSTGKVILYGSQATLNEYARLSARARRTSIASPSSDQFAQSADSA